MALYDIKDISIVFGGLKAVTNFNLSLEKGELVSIIGPNGAGKTTVFNMLSGIYVPTSGELVFEGKKINGTKPFKMTRMGIARTFQNIRLWSNLSVLKNITIAMALNEGYNLFDALVKTKRYRTQEKAFTDRAYELLKHAANNARNLPYGEQRRLEIARALATNPKVLLLDEPVAGMNPSEIEDIKVLIRQIRDEFPDLSIILIEHHMNFVMDIADRIIVLDFG